MARPRHGDVPRTGVQKVWVHTRVGIDQNAFGGETLRAVTGNRITVIEMAMLSGTELNLPVIVEAARDTTIRRH